MRHPFQDRTESDLVFLLQPAMALLFPKWYYYVGTGLGNSIREFWRPWCCVMLVTWRLRSQDKLRCVRHGVLQKGLGSILHENSVWSLKVEEVPPGSLEVQGETGLWTHVSRWAGGPTHKEGAAFLSSVSSESLSRVHPVTSPWEVYFCRRILLSTTQVVLYLRGHKVLAGNEGLFIFFHCACIYLNLRVIFFATNFSI